MSKASPLSPAAVEAAQRVLADAGVREPRHIHVEAIAERNGALVMFGPAETAHAWIVRTMRRAIVHVDERSRNTRRARFAVAHELGHHLLHPLADHMTQCTDTRRRPGENWQVERQANDFATELLTPASLAIAWCRSPCPTVDDVERFARGFETSLEMSALRYVQLTEAPCAVVLAVGGHVKWSMESVGFPGRIVRGRPVHPDTDAARAVSGAPFSTARARTVPGVAWGGKAPFREQALSRWGESSVLSWIVPAAT